MAVLEKTNTLLVGTNGKSILTFDIGKIMKKKPEANFGEFDEAKQDLRSEADSIDMRLRYLLQLGYDEEEK